MSAIVYPLDPRELTSWTGAARNEAQSYTQLYQSAEPYNHNCIDNFLPPETLEKVCADIANLPEAEAAFDRGQEKLNTSDNPERLPLYTRDLSHAFNSRSFILFLEEMTGIKGLIPDPYFNGAGIHRFGF